MLNITAVLAQTEGISSILSSLNAGHAILAAFVWFLASNHFGMREIKADLEVLRGSMVTKLDMANTLTGLRKEMENVADTRFHHYRDQESGSRSATHSLRASPGV